MIATIAGPPDMSPGVDRLRGYRAAITDAGLNDRGLIVYGDFGMASGEHAVYRLLKVLLPDLLRSAPGGIQSGLVNDVG